MKNVMVVLNYNDYETTRQFLHNVSSYRNIFHIVVVDNCSTDDSWKKLILLSNAKITVIAAPKNNGYASGNNYGIRYAENKFNADNLIITNPDIAVSEEDIDKVILALQAGYAMSTGMIYNLNAQTGTATLASNFAWRVPSYCDMLCNCGLGLYKIRRRVLHNSNYFDKTDFHRHSILEVEAVPGCFFAIKASAIKKIEYFDEDTFLFGEENIIGKRLKNAGEKACVVGNATIYHQNSVSIRKSIKKQRALEKMRLDSDVVYLKKYLNINKLKQKLYCFVFKFGCMERCIYKKIRK